MIDDMTFKNKKYFIFTYSTTTFNRSYCNMRLVYTMWSLCGTLSISQVTYNTLFCIFFIFIF